MITKKHREARGLHADTSSYGFMVRMDIDDKDMLRRVQARMGALMGGTPSNPVILGELLKFYLTNAA